MPDAIIAAAGRAVEELGTYIERLRCASSAQSSTTPTTPDDRVGKLQESVAGLRRMLARIRARLADAEETDIRDESIRLWLRELEGVAFAAEDVLDDLAPLLLDGFPWGGHMEELTGAVVQRFGGIALQVRNSGSSNSSHYLIALELFASQCDVEHRIGAVNSRFDEITAHMEALRLGESYGQRHAETPVRRPTSSMITESCIVGREDDLKAVKKFLLDAESSKTNTIPVIAIVGMGGLGKTTLAQLAYNDDSVRKHFDMKLWVFVSENFDLVRLTKAMIESSTRKSCPLTELDPLHIELKEVVDGKKFLLVLDDVWEDENLSNNWDTLTAPLLYGSKGSKIIITTRNEMVSKMTRASLTYALPLLQDDHCVELFRRWAFEGQDPSGSLHTLMGIGRKIAMKCKGLPLVARTLGGLLRGEDDELVWSDILQCDIWDIDEEKRIVPILRLSYQHLPGHLKRCFRYCSVFPKGYEFEQDRLVQMWMAQGYVEAKRKRQMEDVGREYFGDLVRRSFLQYSQKPGKFLMHDLIHELARSVSRDECCDVDGDRSSSIPTDVRHMSLVLYSSDRRSITSPGQLCCEPKTLRSLFFICHSFTSIYSRNLLNDLLTQMKHLRVLDFSYVGLQVLPSSIGCLKHLRYLGLRSNNIGQLPESVGSLYHLQTLDLESTGVTFLPDSITHLLSLRHIIHRGNLNYPVGIGKLTNLQTMAGFLVSSTNDSAKLGELKNINNIRSLRISAIGNLKDVYEAKKACLEKKEQLWVLDLRGTSESPISDEALESLKPNANLKQLDITYFRGQSPPSWLGHSSFSKLGSVQLIACDYLTSLPPLGQLPSLKFLYISIARQVQHIGSEFFSGGFPQLEMLTLKYMENWKSWCGAQIGECCQLRKLTLHYRDHLTSFPVINLHALQGLEITQCGAPLFSSDFLLQVCQLPSLQNILISSASGRQYIEAAFPCGGIPSLETSYLELRNVSQLVAQTIVAQQGKCSGILRLTLNQCANLTSLHLGNLSALQRLEINSCCRLPFTNMGQLPPDLKVLSIHDCDNLQCLPLPNLSALQKLEIQGCCQFQFSNEDQLPPTLQVLSICDCGNLQSLPLANLNSLEMLSISKCARLQFSSQDQMPPVLQLLSIHSCPCLTEWCQYHRKRLLHIQCLQIEGVDGEHVMLRNIHSVQEATDAYLCGLQRLLTLELVWDCNAGRRSFRDEEQEVLKNLQPHINLNKLVIQGYKGSRFAAWLGHLLSLRELILKHCPLLKTLPHLPPSLKELEVADCNVITFTHSLDHLTSLCTLRISQAHVLKNLFGLPLGLRRLVLEGVPVLNDLVPPPSLRCLVLQGCSEAMVTASLPHLTLLTSLHISDFPELTTIPLHNFRILQELKISNCPKLECLDCFSFSPASLEYMEGFQVLMSLERLGISDSPRLHFFANERPPSTLQSMNISNSPLAEPWHDKHWRHCHTHPSR